MKLLITYVGCRECVLLIDVLQVRPLRSAIRNRGLMFAYVGHRRGGTPWNQGEEGTSVDDPSVCETTSKAAGGRHTHR